MIKRLIHSSSNNATFLRFAIVACSISAIDISVLYGLHEGYQVNVFLSRIFSYFLAMTAGYFLNRHFTFHRHQRFRKLLADLVRFYSVFTVGGLINYGIFAVTVTLGHQLGLKPGATFLLPLLGVWLGGMAGMSFNYVVSHKLVFRQP
ncbi:GtrA family protein [Halomonas sp. ATCH28]|uniref:GtrA family protein n=1 Tax=Halomonas gemina TaxID=2945105 RepID=A0ABT0SXF5_9GAMM|nr:GtrA family protein [Halomonas gemina]MCL7939345.1 GtrA family protein [Halomonas gemina]